MERPDERLIAAHADNVSAATGAELSNQACELARWIRHLESTLDGLVAESLSLARDVRGLNAREEEIRAGAVLLRERPRDFPEDTLEEFRAGAVLLRESAGDYFLRTGKMRKRKVKRVPERVPDPKGRGYRTETKPDES